MLVGSVLEACAREMRHLETLQDPLVTLSYLSPVSAI